MNILNLLSKRPESLSFSSRRRKDDGEQVWLLSIAALLGLSRVIPLPGAESQLHGEIS